MELDTQEMRQAMGASRQFTDEERAYDVYTRQLDYIRVQKAFQWGLKDVARKAEETERQLETVQRDLEAARLLEQEAGSDTGPLDEHIERLIEHREGLKKSAGRARQLALEVEIPPWPPEVARP